MLIWFCSCTRINLSENIKSERLETGNVCIFACLSVCFSRDVGRSIWEMIRFMDAERNKGRLFFFPAKNEQMTVSVTTQY